MKKLLTTITFSALLRTIAGNLKPVFTNNVVSHGFKSNQLNNKDISITNENNNPFTPKKITNGFPSDVTVKSVLSISNWGLYVGNEKGLWKSTDGVTFTEIKGITNSVYKIKYFSNRTMYVLTYLSKPGMNEYTIYKSTDANTFTKLTGIPNNLVPCITFSSDGTVYAGTTDFTSSGTGTQGKLYKSTDGATFTEMTEIKGVAGIQDIIISSDKTIYIN